jgi:DNA-binding MarR family transcriptional regulator
MRMVTDWVWNRIIDAAREAGFDDLNPAHFALFRYPGLSGRRPSEVAAQFLITKQSVNDLIGHLEAHGYIRREPDPSDRRARVIRLTRSGTRLQRVVRDAAKRCEDEIAALLGPTSFRHLQDALAEMSTLTDEDRPIPAG